MCLMYDAAPMPEAKLPPVYVRKEHKRLKMDPSGDLVAFLLFLLTLHIVSTLLLLKGTLCNVVSN